MLIAFHQEQPWADNSAQVELEGIWLMVVWAAENVSERLPIQRRDTFRLRKCLARSVD